MWIRWKNLWTKYKNKKLSFFIHRLSTGYPQGLPLWTKQKSYPQSIETLPSNQGFTCGQSCGKNVDK